MKTFIIDKDDVAAQMVKAKLEPLGHQVDIETSKATAEQRLSSHQYDIIFLDPSPLTTAKPLILNIRRMQSRYPYIIQTSADPEHQEGETASGANDCMLKPFDPAEIEEKVENAVRMAAKINQIGDDSKDFPSAGGVIAKSAFNQLFISSLERSDRYGEQTYILFISLSNYRDILEMEGAYGADYAVAKLSQHLVFLRRQSDIIGQTAKNEYALLLQRPGYEGEPLEAAKRFAEALDKYEGVTSPGSMPIEITISLMNVPAGALLFEHVVRHNEKP